MFLDHVHFHNYDEVESTQTLARDELKAGSINHGHIISATYQSAGYGRQSRKWHHKFGNIALSIVLNPEVDATVIPQLTYVAGLATLVTILSFNQGVNVRLKWVNDILIEDKKVAGILCEIVNDQYAIVGIGVNIESNHDIKEVNGSSLADFGITVGRDAFIEKLLENFKDCYNHWCDYGFNPIRTQWCKYAYKEGDELTVKLPGDRVLNGTFAKITEDGKLVLNVKGKPHTIAAGEI